MLLEKQNKALIIKREIQQTNMQRNLIIIVSFIFISLSLSGQARYFDERYITTQHFLNPVLVNPGATGNSMYHRLIGNYRSNWSTFPGAPKSYFFSYDGPIGNKLGFGAVLLSDRNGDLQTTKGQAALSYTIESENNKLGFGITGEYLQHSLNGSVVSNPLNSQDTELANRLNGTEFFDVSFGINGLYNGNISYGLVFPNLVSSRLDDLDEGFDSEFNYILHAGYMWDVEGYDFNVEPSVFVKQLNYVPLHIDLNVLMYFLDDKLLGGLTYTIGADERFGFTIGTRVNALNFAYSYNVSRNELISYTNGAHEFSVKIDLGRKDASNQDAQTIEMDKEK